VIQIEPWGTGAELLAEEREHFWWPGARAYFGNRAGFPQIHRQSQADPGEKVFGMGQRTHGRLDHKGLALDLVRRNAEVSILFVRSDRGYGFLWSAVRRLPGRPGAWSVDDKFMLGPDTLVAPVAEPGMASRSVYLLAGTGWSDAWSGDDHDGGTLLQVSTPLERIPVYLRAGSDIPPEIRVRTRRGGSRAGI
jgi:alpha-glucosidase (family GH31 glycosyl hydrolase)